MKKTLNSRTKPTYPLAEIKKQFNSQKGLRMTFSARQGAVSIGFSDYDVIAAIQALKESDFYKSMVPLTESFKHWQDVYKSCFAGVELYIKFQRAKNGQFFMLISFKEK
ncbi:type II toxin-antitoxin system MqsR family toxin [Endozoicomonas sp. 4G]|uniref:type II toxin-antitoxin system MqsR family toxin n=1 Tax=Endozoicomonas sp. 4G TaxID=2872754 RepID=UPI0020785413|nr:type II toxin-antitoxin system MqsR family toxin [Endozoicomonas sp. 4G]